MARIRTIKPDLAYDEELASLPERTRLFFILLWCHCDKAGRAEDKPGELRAKIFPYHPEIDVEAILSDLAPKFVVRYAAKGKNYLQVRTWDEHQRPNKSEAPSTTPPPTERQLLTSNDVKKHHATSKTLRKGSGKEVEGKGKDLASASPTPEVVKPMTPIQYVMRAYKVAKGIDPNDKDWDKAQFSKWSRAAQKLLACFDGNDKKAVAYLVMKGMEWDESGLDSWTLAAIASHAWDNRAKLIGGENGLDDSKVGDSISDRSGRSRLPTRAGEIAMGAMREIEAGAQAATRLAGSGIREESRDESQPDTFLAAEDGFGDAGSQAETV